VDLTRDKISELIRKIAIPSSIGTLFQTLYNIVDAKFAGLISPEAIIAIAKSFPIYFIIIGATVGLSAGVSALISNALGKKDESTASFLFSQSILVSIVASIIVTAIGIYGTEPILILLKTGPEIISYATDYMHVIFLGSILFFLQLTINASLVSRGDTKSLRNVHIVSFFLNIVLNPIFIYGFYFIPAMGISGIALATLCAQFYGLIYIIYKVNQTDLKKYIYLECFYPKINLLKGIIRQAAPATGSMMFIGFGIFVLLYYVSTYGDYSAGGYGAAIRFEQLFLLPVLGLNASTLSLVGQNFGALNFDRIRETYLKSILYGTVFMGICGIFIFFASSYIMIFFSNDPQIIFYGSTYLKVAAFAGPCYPIFFISSALLQGLKKPVYQMMINLMRMVVLPIVALTIAVIYLKVSFFTMFLVVLSINYVFATIVFWFSVYQIKLEDKNHNPNLAAV
jgi:putative MATE family efflux protein